LNGAVVADVRHNCYRDTQRSREGEIRIIDPADHEDKKVKNMLTLVLQAPTHWIVVENKEKECKIVQMKGREGR
jgi:hypothetical protein